MKKTISINIAGIVFYIEEDGYEKLSAYLKAIQKYFSAYEGSKEIVEDIESRIAEKFWDKQKKEDKQAISLDDVNELIHSMGSVADFQALEEEEDLAKMSGQKAKTESAEFTTSSEKAKEKPGTSEIPNEQTQIPLPHKRLYRDVKRKLLGGVCAGIAHYLNFDPIWVRLFFLIFLFVGSPVTNSPLSAFPLVLYIAFWVAFPANATLEEDDKVKKFYRNPEGKVLGGVVNGVASYTGWDLGMLRFLFVLSIVFFGTGIVAYVVLWAISPEAKTLTDRMQMTGEPITLENIETNIKRSLNLEGKQEDSLSKILLFPFRAMAEVFKAFTPLAKFFLTALRIFAGFIMVSTALGILFSLFVALFAGVAALESAPVFIFHDIPFGVFAKDFSSWSILALFLACAAPTVAVGLGGISLIVKRNLFVPLVWQSLFGVFFIGSIICLFEGTRYAANFSTDQSIEKTVNYTTGNSIPLFDIEDYQNNFNLRPSLELEGYDGEALQVQQVFKAEGQNKVDAERNAQTISYGIIQKDSVIKFDNIIELKEHAFFRDQRLRMKLFIPYEKPFSMTEEFARFVENTFDNGYFDHSEGDLFKGSLWKITKNGDIVCLNRKPVIRDENGNNEDNAQDFPAGDFIKYFDKNSFKFVKIEGKDGAVCDVHIRQGDHYSVKAGGFRENMNDIEAEVKDGTLYLKNISGVAKVIITMPELRGININTSGNSNIENFNVNKLEVLLANNQVLTLNGRWENIKAKLANSSELKAFDSEIVNADIEVNQNATAKVNVLEELKAKAADSGTVLYKGSASVTKSTTNSGSVKEVDHSNE